MKRSITGILIPMLLLSLVACGKSEKLPAPEQRAEPTAVAAEPTPEPTAVAAEPTFEPTTEPTATPAPISPYNWLGYPEVAACRYLDLLAAQHYYRTYTSYIDVGGNAVGVNYIDAVDAGNSYRYDESGQMASYNLEGLCYDISERTKTYRTQDLTELFKAAPPAAMQIAANENYTGKQFAGVGTGDIPIYSAVDPAEYAYYEYVTGSGAMQMTERLYLKNGDVYAVYTRVGPEDSSTAYVNVIADITGDIPANLFALPDLSDYEQK